MRSNNDSQTLVHLLANNVHVAKKCAWSELFPLSFEKRKRVEMYYKNTNTFIRLAIQVCIYSINNLCMPGTVLGAGDTVMNWRQTGHYLP